jgi:hypothetical protein
VVGALRARGTQGAQLWMRASGILWRSTPSSIVLLPIDADEPFLLTGSSGPIWEALAEPRTLDEIAVYVATRYAVETRHILPDIAAVLRDLERLGAVAGSNRSQ